MRTFAAILCLSCFSVPQAWAQTSVPNPRKILEETANAINAAKASGQADSQLRAVEQSAGPSAAEKLAAHALASIEIGIVFGVAFA